MMFVRTGRVICKAMVWGALTLVPVHASASLLIEDFEAFTNCPDTGAVVTCPLTNGWVNAANGTVDDNDWRVDSGGTSSGSTGPSADHTLGQVFTKYLYTEASGSTGVGSNATNDLLMPVLDLSAASNVALSFWYHMFGLDMGTLSVGVSTDGGTNFSEVFSRTGDQGNQWLEAMVDLGAYDGQNDVRIRIRGVTGNGFRSDMAVDDFLVFEAEVPEPAGIAAVAAGLTFIGWQTRQRRLAG